MWVISGTETISGLEVRVLSGSPLVKIYFASAPTFVGGEGLTLPFRVPVPAVYLQPANVPLLAVLSERRISNLLAVTEGDVTSPVVHAFLSSQKS
jgi:hypothetical protein